MTLSEKESLILDQEKQFARSVASRVIEKPKLSIWMILIPIIFVHYFYRWNRYSEGHKKFAEDFIKTRQAALEEASAALNSSRRADAEKLVARANLPPETTDYYKEWINVLLDHYTDLLSAEGGSFNELVRSAYRTKENYLLYLHSLSQSEKCFNNALKPSLSAATDGVYEIVTAIENSCRDLRREQAETIFSSRSL